VICRVFSLFYVPTKRGSIRSLLNRFDVTVSSWKSFNYTAFIIILLKKIKTNKKSR
jgi:hypothetical protein